MLVGHYPVDAFFVGQGVLLVVLVVQHVGLFRVEVCVGKVDSARLVLGDFLLIDVGIGLLRVKVQLYGIFRFSH